MGLPPTLSVSATAQLHRLSGTAPDDIIDVIVTCDRTLVKAWFLGGVWGCCLGRLDRCLTLKS